MWLVNVYVPNSGEGLRRLDYRIIKWDKALADYIKVTTAAAASARGSRPVIRGLLSVLLTCLLSVMRACFLKIRLVAMPAKWFCLSAGVACTREACCCDW